MKNLFLATLALVALASCSKENAQESINPVNPAEGSTLNISFVADENPDSRAFFDPAVTAEV